MIITATTQVNISQQEIDRITTARLNQFWLRMNVTADSLRIENGNLVVDYTVAGGHEISEVLRKATELDGAIFTVMKALNAPYHTF